MSNNFRSNAEIIVKANVTGAIFECKEGLSFWGGVDPSTGCIVDVHHINHGNSLVGKLVLMHSLSFISRFPIFEPITANDIAIR